MKKQTNLSFLKIIFFIFLNRFSVLMLKIILKNKKYYLMYFPIKKNNLKIITTVITNTPLTFHPKITCQITNYCHFL